MTRIVIIEDEEAACQALLTTLYGVASDVKVLATLTSVQQGIQYLSKQNEADLIFSDVQLTDGLSFSIFQQVPVLAPIVFVTGYDKFMLNAFEYNSIDYLLKPVAPEDLLKTLDKYRRLQQHFSQHNAALAGLLHHFDDRRKTRVIVKKGLEHVSLLLDDVVLFYTENKVVYVLDKYGKKYLADKNLTDLETELDEKSFFRVNRQYIVNIGYIRAFKAYERVKLQVELTVSDLPHFVIVSQETAPLFRRWIAQD